MRFLVYAIRAPRRKVPRVWTDGVCKRSVMSLGVAALFHAGETMRLEELRSRLRGVIAFPITPFKPDLSLDIPGLRRNLQQLLQHPIAAIVAAGGTGEMYS